MIILTYKNKLLTCKKGGENMKKIYKNLMSLAMLALLITPIFAFQASPVLAQNKTADFGIDKVEAGLGGTLATTDPRAIIGNIINVALGFLGVIAVGIILMGGFKWMTAGGGEEKVTEAKKLIGAGVIGLVIILASWAISTFVIEAIYGATTGKAI